MLFDLLWLDGHSTTALPYADAVGCSSGSRSRARRGRRRRRRSAGATAVLQTATDLGLEGVVAKRLDSPYLPGKRSDAWRKLKPARARSSSWAAGSPATVDSTAGLGSLLVGFHDADGALHYAGRVGSGLDETSRTPPRRLLAPSCRADEPVHEDAQAADADMGGAARRGRGGLPRVDTHRRAPSAPLQGRPHRQGRPGGRARAAMIAGISHGAWLSTHPLHSD